MPQVPLISVLEKRGTGMRADGDLTRQSWSWSQTHQKKKELALRLRQRKGAKTVFEWVGRPEV